VDAVIESKLQDEFDPSISFETITGFGLLDGLLVGLEFAGRLRNGLMKVELWVGGVNARDSLR